MSLTANYMPLKNNEIIHRGGKHQREFKIHGDLCAKL